MYSPELVRRLLMKMAFVDPATAAGGGAPPMDPAMMGMGGGGAPPMDPAMMGMGGGGAPPMDPAMLSALGGGAPAAGGLTEDRVRQIVQEVVAQVGGAGGGSAANAGSGKKKDDLAAELHQIKKLLIYLMQASGLQLPPDFLLNEGEAPVAGTAAAPPLPPPQTIPGAIPPIEPIRPASSVLVGGQ